MNTEVGHQIRTYCSSHGMYGARCDCGDWWTSPVYNSHTEAKAAGRDHLDEVLGYD